MHYRAGITPLAQRTALRLARHIPFPLLEYSERICLNLAAVVLGVAAFWPPKGGVVENWPLVLQWLWASGMIVAGVVALHGTWTGFRPSERLGAGLYAACAAIYMVTVATTFGWAATGTTIIFASLTIAKTLRVIRSLAASAQAQGAIAINREVHGEGGAPDGR